MFGWSWGDFQPYSGWSIVETGMLVGIVSLVTFVLGNGGVSAFLDSRHY